MSGATRSRSTSSVMPSSDSSTSRYIHAAEPVYQVQPPRPGAPIPLAVPSVLLEMSTQRCCLPPARPGEALVSPRLGQRREPLEHVVQKEPEPHALALALVAYEVHSVVPVPGAHQRETVRAEAQAVLDGAHAVLIERAGLVGVQREVVVAVLVAVHAAPLEERDDLLEDPGVCRRPDVPADRARQEEVVVGDAGSHPPAKEGMPPVLHIPLAKLPARGQ